MASEQKISIKLKLPHFRTRLTHPRSLPSRRGETRAPSVPAKHRVAFGSPKHMADASCGGGGASWTGWSSKRSCLHWNSRAHFCCSFSCTCWARARTAGKIDLCVRADRSKNYGDGYSGRVRALAPSTSRVFHALAHPPTPKSRTKLAHNLWLARSFSGASIAFALPGCGFCVRRAKESTVPFELWLWGSLNTLNTHQFRPDVESNRLQRPIQRRLHESLSPGNSRGASWSFLSISFRIPTSTDRL